MKIHLQFMSWKPLMELLKMLSPLMMLWVQVLIVFTWTVQSRWGVKNTPKYHSEVAGFTEMRESLGSCRETVHGAMPCLALEVGVTRGWKNMTLHLSLSTEKLDCLSQDKMCCAT